MLLPGTEMLALAFVPILLPGVSFPLIVIAAAVVGVILNQAVWFGLHALFAEVGEADLGPLRFSVPAATRACCRRWRDARRRER
jgi:hypothetical protein